MLNDTERPFTLTLTDSGLCLPVLRFSGQEALNQPYRFEIEVIGLGPTLTPDQWLHQPAFLQMAGDHGIHGVIQSLRCEHRGAFQTQYQVVLAPALQALAHPARRRVFTGLSVPAIVRQLLEENGLAADSYRLDMSVGIYPPRPFCIQYEESDLALLQRLCEEEGIHYHFEHRPEGHVMVLADDSLGLPQEPVPIGFGSRFPGISRLFQHHDAGPVTLLPTVRNRGDSKTTEPAANQSVGVTTEPTVRLPAAQHHAQQRTRRQLERQRCLYRTVHGRSDYAGARAGHLLQVSGHPITGFNEQWLVTELHHHGEQPVIGAPATAMRRYHNDFSAQPWSTDYRPPLKQPRPSIAGYHLACVRGHAGEAPELDENGRIAVHLWPAGDRAKSQVIWLPIAMTGAPLTATQLPRAGSEGWVSFLDGDPDRPILCVGTAHVPPRPTEQPEPEDDLLLDWLLNRAQP